jgi:ABC-type transport system involved in multi-copper enzyme maturation permease subunit
MNPVLVNDLRKNIFRRKPVLGVAYMAVAILVLVFAVYTLMPVGQSWQMKQYPLWRFPDMLLPLLAPAFAAGSFAKEHEQRTWQDILLTRLSGSEILIGKFFSCYLPTLVSLIVMFPPFSLLLIIQGVDWALEPGFWVITLAIKILIAVTFYVTLSLVVSYHSPNARIALAITYCTLAGYALANYAAWTYIIEPMFMMNPDPYNSYSSSNAWSYLGSDSRSLTLSPIDWLVMMQAAALAAAMLFYLSIRLRERTE